MVKREKTKSYDSGILVNQEVGPILESINKYISGFGDNKPKSITLNTYDWAIMDLSLRQSTANVGSLHNYSFNDLIVLCEDGECYCHYFLASQDTRDIVKTINNYLEVMNERLPLSLPIDPVAKNILNSRFDNFFNNKINLDSNPQLAVQIIRVAGQELYKTNYA